MDMPVPGRVLTAVSRLLVDSHRIGKGRLEEIVVADVQPDHDLGKCLAFRLVQPDELAVMPTR